MSWIHFCEYLGITCFPQQHKNIKGPFCHIDFFKQFLEDISPFCGTLFWTSGDVSSGFQSHEWAALFMLGVGIHATCSLIFTSGAMPAELLVANMVFMICGDSATYG